MAKCTQFPEKCHTSSALSLAKSQRVYGVKPTKVWLEMHLAMIAEYAGVKEKMTAEQIKMCAELILATYYFLNLDEMLCFFGQFMTTGKFYGQVDPMTITRALNDYCKDRSARLAMIESERARIERDKELARTDTCSYEEYQQMKERGEI